MRRLDRVTAAVLAVALVGTIARLVRLGVRPFHWEEARVGYWTLRYAETGSYTYRPVGGGPLLYHLNETLFGLVPVTDGSARLAVALLGGGVAAGALLFRSRLRDDETVALAIVLAFAPLLLYYSRFLRGDVPVAVFAFLAVGFLLRAVDVDSPRYLYGAGVLGGLAVAASMQALGYAVVFAAAFVAAADHRRVRNAAGISPRRVKALCGFADRWLGPAAGGVLTFAATLFVTFAPRGEGISLGLFEAAIVDPFGAATGVYVMGREGPTFLDALSFAGETLLVLSFPVLIVAVIGFFAERYGIAGADAVGSAGTLSGKIGGSRLLVRWAGLAAGFGVLVFPLANEVLAPWVLVHVTVLLAIPAAVGLALLVRSARAALDEREAARLVAAILVLLAVAVPAAALAADAYASPADPTESGDTLEASHDRFAHFAQPADDLEPLVGEMSTAVEDSGSVVYVGDRYYTVDDRAFDAPPLSQGESAVFAERLPLAWYLERAGAHPESFADPAALDPLVAGEDGEEPPAVVITDPEHGDEVAARLDEYEQRSYRTALIDREAVVFFR